MKVDDDLRAFYAEVENTFLFPGGLDDLNRQNNHKEYEIIHMQRSQRFLTGSITPSQEQLEDIVKASLIVQDTLRGLEISKEVYNPEEFNEVFKQFLIGATSSAVRELDIRLKAKNMG